MASAVFIREHSSNEVKVLTRLHTTTFSLKFISEKFPNTWDLFLEIILSPCEPVDVRRDPYKIHVIWSEATVDTVASLLQPTPNMAPKEDDHKWEVEELGMKMVLISTRGLYMCRTTMPEKSFDKVMSFTKIMANKTDAKREVR